MSLPNHVPIFIKKADIHRFNRYIMQKGYKWIFLQIVKPRQIVGRVKSIVKDDKQVEHHIRVFTNGKITTEYEPPRVKEMWHHISSISYSAHERVIEYLHEAGIEFTVDEEFRKLYNEKADPTYPYDRLEFWRWLFPGVLLWVPIGWAWRGIWEIRCKLFGNPLREDGLHKGTMRDTQEKSVPND